MAVMLCARECRSGSLGNAAKLLQVVEKSTVQDLVHLHKTIKTLKETADVGKMFRPIDLADAKRRRGW